MGNVSEVSEGLAQAIAAAGDAIVRVEGGRRHPATGIVWKNDLVVTTSHAIRAAEGLTVTAASGEPIRAALVGRDSATDTAVLRLSGGELKPLHWSETDPRVGNLTLVAGRPGRSVRVTLGVVSAAAGEWKTHDGTMIDRYIEVDASLPAGFSGGPLLDVTGACLGMNTSRLTRGGTTIPTKTLIRIASEIAEHGRVRRPRLGIGVHPVEAGLLVMSVEPKSAAERGGILVGDILKAAGGTQLDSPRSLSAALQRMIDGANLDLAITRGGEARTIKVTPG